MGNEVTGRREGILRFAFAFAATLFVSGCGGLNPLTMFDGGDDDESERLQGERISVMSLDQALEADPALAGVPVALPAPYVNEDWPQPGGYPSHAMQHLEIPDTIERAWSVKIGDGSNADIRLTEPPIVAGGRVFARDAGSKVTAVDIATGRRVWQVDLKPKKSDRELGTGGGVAYLDGRIFATIGFGFAVALDAETGTEIWRQDLGLPVRAAPTADDGRVYVTTYDNQFYALDATDGRILWNYRATPETAQLLVGSSPAVSGDVVIAPFTSGEVLALRAQNGRVAWTDALQRTGTLTPLATLNDIAGRPVVDRGRVFAVSHNGRMVSIDLRSGERVWIRDIGSVHTPWVAGDYVYVLTVDGELICLNWADGRIRWLTPLQQFKNEKKRKDMIQWSGPVLAGDRLLVVSSQGEALSVSPYTGEILGRIKIPDGGFISPVVANRTVFILTDGAELIAYR